MKAWRFVVALAVLPAPADLALVVQLPVLVVLAFKPRLLVLAELVPVQLVLVAQLPVLVVLVVLAVLALKGRVPAVAVLVVEAAVPLQRLLSRQSLSAAMARSTP